MVHESPLSPTMVWVVPLALRLLKPVWRSMRLLVPLHSQFLKEHINGSMLRQEPNGGNANGGNADEALVTQPERLAVEPISPFWKCAILLVFAAQSTPHRCKSCMGFLFWVSMKLYIPKTTKMTSFLNAQFNHRAHTSSALAA